MKRESNQIDSVYTFAPTSGGVVSVASLIIIREGGEKRNSRICLLNVNHWKTRTLMRSTRSVEPEDV